MDTICLKSERFEALYALFAESTVDTLDFICQVGQLA